jgi:hypothetical protein
MGRETTQTWMVGVNRRETAVSFDSPKEFGLVFKQGKRSGAGEEIDHCSPIQKPNRAIAINQ